LKSGKGDTKLQLELSSPTIGHWEEEHIQQIGNMEKEKTDSAGYCEAKILESGKWNQKMASVDG
jgi:hypothetical protein